MMLTQEWFLVYEHVLADETYQFTSRLVECSMLPVKCTDVSGGKIDDFDTRRFAEVL